jgi:hypothetical protein
MTLIGHANSVTTGKRTKTTQPRMISMLGKLTPDSDTDTSILVTVPDLSLLL